MSRSFEENYQEREEEDIWNKADEAYDQLRYEQYEAEQWLREILRREYNREVDQYNCIQKIKILYRITKIEAIKQLLKEIDDSLYE